MTSDVPTDTKKSSLLNSADVEQYLSENPDFFIGKDSLIKAITLPHKNKGAISLVERQVKVLRNSNTQLQQDIDNFIAKAKKNDALFEKIRLVILELLNSRSIAELSTTIATKLCHDLVASTSKLIFIGDHNESMLSLKQTKQALGDLFDKQRAFCGPLDKQQAALFFPDESPKIISAAIIPVHLTKPALIESLGLPMLLIGSHKAEHFKPGLDTLFLDFIGEILAIHISQLEPTS